MKAGNYEQDCIKAQEVYDNEYSTGEYCHEQSFLWGFQEGCDYKERSFLNKTKETDMITREELANSIEYWKETQEILCYRENIEPTLQLADKKEMIDKACELLKRTLPMGYDEEHGKYYDYINYEEFRKAMEE